MTFIGSGQVPFEDAKRRYDKQSWDGNASADASIDLAIWTIERFGHHLASCELELNFPPRSCVARP